MSSKLRRWAGKVLGVIICQNTTKVAKIVAATTAAAKWALIEPRFLTPELWTLGPDFLSGVRFSRGATPHSFFFLFLYFSGGEKVNRLTFLSSTFVDCEICSSTWNWQFIDLLPSKSHLFVNKFCKKEYVENDETGGSCNLSANMTKSANSFFAAATIRMFGKC